MTLPAPIWVPVDAVIDLHTESIEEFGGASGIRDEGLLRSALARPENLLVYKTDTDLFELAAAYASGITNNHPFVDGNKRAAFFTAYIFLDLNGYSLDETEARAEEMIMALSRKDIGESDFASWLRDMCRPKIQDET